MTEHEQFKGHHPDRNQTLIENCAHRFCPSVATGVPNIFHVSPRGRYFGLIFCGVCAVILLSTGIFVHQYIQHQHEELYTMFLPPALPPILSQLRTNRTALFLCSNISVQPQEFEVTLCQNPAEGFGVVHIVRLIDCAENLQVSRYYTTDRFLKQRFGPDAIQITISVREVIAPRVYHVGNCTYEAAYQLYKAGYHLMKIRHVFANYGAVTEMFDNDLPKSNAVRFYWDKVIGLSAEVIRDQPQQSQQQLPAPSKPNCTSGVAPGRWVYVNRYLWVWEPFDCFYPAMAWGKQEFIQCLAWKNVTVIGDSQSRTVFYAMMNQLARIPLHDDRYMQGNTTRAYEVSSVKFEFNIDQYLEIKERWGRVMGSTHLDALIVGMGNWPAAGSVGNMGRWPDVRYRRHILKKATELQAFKERSPKTGVFWLGMPAHPHPPRDQRRSGQRILHMAEFAADVMRKAGIPVIDSYLVSEGMTFTSKDGSHYLNHVTDAIARITLNEVCRYFGRVS